VYPIRDVAIRVRWRGRTARRLPLARLLATVRQSEGAESRGRRRARTTCQAVARRRL